MFKRIKNMSRKIFSRKFILGFFGAMVFISFLNAFDLLPVSLEKIMGVPEAFAVNETKETNVLQKMGEMFSALLLAAYMLFFPILSLIGMLMENDFVMGGDMQNTLNEVWKIIRDFANVIFVFILLIVAFVNVVGLGDAVAQYEMKKMVPRIIAALILVNFTFFFSKVAIDGANILTAAIYSIPSDSDIAKARKGVTDVNTIYSYDCDLERYKQGKEWVKTEKINSSSFKDGEYNGGNSYIESGSIKGKEMNFEVDRKKLAEDQVVCFFVLAPSDYGPDGGGTGTKFVASQIPYVMATSFSGIVDINKVADGVNSGVTLTINSFFQLFMFLVLFFAFLALLVALVVRVVMLWVLVILSPLVVIQKLILSGSSFGGDFDAFDAFIKYLLIPVKVAVVMMIGLVMVTTIPKFFESEQKLQTLENRAQTSTMADDKMNKINIGKDPSTLQFMMFWIMSVGILWVGVFWSFKGTKAEGFTEPIKKAGQWVMKSPQYAKIPGTGGMSVAGLGRLKSNFKNHFMEMNVNEPADALSKKLGFGDNSSRNTVHKFLDKSKSSGKDKAGVMRDLKVKIENDRNFAKTFAGMSGQDIKENFTKEHGFDQSIVKKLATDQKDYGAWERLGKAMGVSGFGGTVETAHKNADNPTSGNNEANVDRNIGNQVQQSINKSRTENEDNDQSERRMLGAFLAGLTNRYQDGNNIEADDQDVKQLHEAISRLSDQVEASKISGTMEDAVNDIDRHTEGASKDRALIEMSKALIGVMKEQKKKEGLDDSAIGEINANGVSIKEAEKQFKDKDFDAENFDFKGFITALSEQVAEKEKTDNES